MHVNSVSKSPSFGLKLGGVTNIVFDAAKKCANKEAGTNPEIIDFTNNLIKRIKRRAPHSILNTTGADFYLEQGTKKYYMTDVVPGAGLIDSLKRLDISLAKFDKEAKSGGVKSISEFTPPRISSHPPIMVKINPDSELGTLIKNALNIRKSK